MTEAKIEPPADAPTFVPMPQSDQRLIEELRKRGYRVFPAKRVRIYSAAHAIGHGEQHRMPPDAYQAMLAHMWRRMALDTGAAIFEAKALVRTHYDDDGFRSYRSSVMVVLPNDFDFEQEMWGVRS